MPKTKSADDILKYFSYFYQRTGLAFHANSLLVRMSDPVFWVKKRKKCQFVVNLLFAEFAQKMVKVMVLLTLTSS